MMDSSMMIFLPLLGVVLGAALQYWLGRAADREKNIEVLQSQAYADYLRAVAAAAHLRSDGDLRDAHRDAADSKARIAVYGTPAVVKALARFEEAGAFISNGRSVETFIALVSSMRSAGAVSNDDLKTVLIGPSHSE